MHGDSNTTGVAVLMAGMPAPRSSRPTALVSSVTRAQGLKRGANSRPPTLVRPRAPLRLDPRSSFKRRRLTGTAPASRAFASRSPKGGFVASALCAATASMPVHRVPAIRSAFGCASPARVTGDTSVVSAATWAPCQSGKHLPRPLCGITDNHVTRVLQLSNPAPRSPRTSLSGTLRGGPNSSS